MTYVSSTLEMTFRPTPHYENALIDALYEGQRPQESKARPLRHSPAHDIPTRAAAPLQIHLSKEQATQLVAPHPDTLELTDPWPEHRRGAPPSSTSTTQCGSWLTLTGVSYQLYRRTGTNDTTILRTSGYYARTHTRRRTSPPRIPGGHRGGAPSEKRLSRELVTVMSPSRIDDEREAKPESRLAVQDDRLCVGPQLGRTRMCSGLRTTWTKYPSPADFDGVHDPNVGCRRDLLRRADQRR